MLVMRGLRAALSSIVVVLASGCPHNTSGESEDSTESSGERGFQISVDRQTYAGSCSLTVREPTDIPNGEHIEQPVTEFVVLAAMGDDSLALVVKTPAVLDAIGGTVTIELADQRLRGPGEPPVRAFAALVAGGEEFQTGSGHLTVSLREGGHVTGTYTATVNHLETFEDERTLKGEFDGSLSLDCQRAVGPGEWTSDVSLSSDFCSQFADLAVN